MLFDIRYSLRQLRKSPGFTLTAVLTLAVGIGGVTAVFSVVNAVLLRPLLFKDPARLVRLHEGVAHQFDTSDLSPPDVLTFQRDSRAFSGVAGFINAEYEVTGAGEPLKARAERISAAFFPVLGASPMLGRSFTQKEDDDSVPVTILSYALWRDRFHSDPAVLGRTIDLDRRPYTVVGVMPRSFEAPEAHTFLPRDLWVPLSLTPQEKQMEGDNYDYSAIARLKPGVNMAEAKADIDRVIQQIQEGYPAGVQLLGSILSLKDETVEDARPLLRILFAAVVLILLIACANLANLLLVRAAGRKREFGVRLAIGAPRRKMLGQALIESLLLSLIGGGLGLLLAFALAKSAPAFLPDSLPRLSEVAISWPVIAVALTITTLTGLFCGLAPALLSIHADVLDSVREGSLSAGTGKSQHRLRAALVVAETAIAMVLLVGSGLLLRSFARMLETEPGFQPQSVLTADVALPAKTYPTEDKVVSFFTRLERRVAALPGVRAVGFGSDLPVIGQNSGRLFYPEGYVRGKNEGWLIAANYLVQGDYFGALRIPLLQGRYLNAADDRPGAPLVMVVSQSLARRYWPHQSAIGRRLKVGASANSPMPWITIVGVVGDIKQDGLDQKTAEEAYQPLAQLAPDLGPMGAIMGPRTDLRVVVRTTSDPTGLAESLRKSVSRLDPLLAVTEVKTMDSMVSSTEAPRRFNTLTVTAFAGIALLLALLGIYGVLAYAVTERTREIAIRMALGSTREAILTRTVRSALALAGIGIAAGLIASAALTRFLASLLYGVKPLDAVTFLSAALVLLACAGLAGWLPARRAASVDPMQVLRSE